MQTSYEVHDSKQISALIHPIRKLIIARLMHGASTSSEVSKSIGIPANKVHYHMRILEKAGLVKLVRTRQVGSVKELYFEPIAENIVIRPNSGDNQISDLVYKDVSREMKQLLQDWRWYQRAGEEVVQQEGAYFSMLHMTADENGQGVLDTALDSLHKAYERGRRDRPGREYRLMVALIPNATQP
jgi:DNA-binding transcriptional ArsR family regulator